MITESLPHLLHRLCICLFSRCHCFLALKTLCVVQDLHRCKPMLGLMSRPASCQREDFHCPCCSLRAAGHKSCFASGLVLGDESTPTSSCSCSCSKVASSAMMGQTARMIRLRTESGQYQTKSHHHKVSCAIKEGSTACPAASIFQQGCIQPMMPQQICFMEHHAPFTGKICAGGAVYTQMRRHR